MLDQLLALAGFRFRGILQLHHSLVISRLLLIGFNTKPDISREEGPYKAGFCEVVSLCAVLVQCIPWCCISLLFSENCYQLTCGNAHLAWNRHPQRRNCCTVAQPSPKQPTTPGTVCTEMSSHFCNVAMSLVSGTRRFCNSSCRGLGPP